MKLEVEDLSGHKHGHEALSSHVDFYAPYHISGRTLSILRLISCVISTILFLHREIFSPAEHTPDYTFLTIWANTACMVYFWAINIIVQVVPKPDPYMQQRLPTFRFMHVFVELLAAMMFVVCLMFWGFLLPDLNVQLQNNPAHYWDIIIDAYGFHLLTPILTWVEVYYNQVCFKTKDGLIYIPILALVYSCLNFYWTKKFGIPVYAPLDWESFGSVGFLMAAFSIVGIGFALAKHLWNHKAKVLARQWGN
mmetsp:Transcript_22211/g.25720  ORF Transcript_22211/g.25720 Transcript_22211/m.25720 type:complete len:251 (+) Transcript_22211:64-816(+)